MFSWFAINCITSGYSYVVDIINYNPFYIQYITLQLYIYYEYWDCNMEVS